MRDTHHDRSSIGEQIVDTVRDGDAGGVGAKIVVVDQAGRQIPARARIPEVADQFAFFGIHANHRKAVTLEAMAQRGDILELLVAEGAGVGGEILVIGA